MTTPSQPESPKPYSADELICLSNDMTGIDDADTPVEKTWECRAKATAEHLRSLELQVAKLPKPMTEAELLQYANLHLLTFLNKEEHRSAVRGYIEAHRDLGLIVEEKSNA